MGARQLGVLSLFSWTSALWVVTQNPESVPFPTVSPSHDPQLPFPALWLYPWVMAPSLASAQEACTAREVGVRGAPLCPGATHSRRSLATRCPSLRARPCPGVSESPP